jgi:hypothetical protein
MLVIGISRDGYSMNREVQEYEVLDIMNPNSVLAYLANRQDVYAEKDFKEILVISNDKVKVHYYFNTMEDMENE